MKVQADSILASLLGIAGGIVLRENQQWFDGAYDAGTILLFGNIVALAIGTILLFIVLKNL
jgi:hypothetical protein